MEDLKEHVRYMMNGRKPDPIFIRHTATSKSSREKGDRQRNDYCQKHFQSILVNDKYKRKLKGRVVCVFDDYLTYGNTFEALRNLLVKCEVKKIIFVSIGNLRVSMTANTSKSPFLLKVMYTQENTQQNSTLMQNTMLSLTMMLDEAWRILPS